MKRLLPFLLLTGSAMLFVAGGTLFGSPVTYRWTDHKALGTRLWQAIASSADGTHLAAVVAQGDIYTSADSGATWTDQTAAGSHTWAAIASSVDGTHLAAACGLPDVGGGGGWEGNIYTSSDSGMVWTAQTSAGRQLWKSIASSANGRHLAAVAWNGDVWTGVEE